MSYQTKLTVFDRSRDVHDLFSKTTISFLSCIRKIERALPGYECTAHIDINIYHKLDMYDNTNFSLPCPTEGSLRSPASNNI